MSWQQNLATLGGGVMSGVMAGAAAGPAGMIAGGLGGGLIAGLQLLANAEQQGRADEAARIQQELLAKFGPMVDQAKALLEKGGEQALPQLQNLEAQAAALTAPGAQRVSDAATMTGQQTRDLLGNIQRSTNIMEQQAGQLPAYYQELRQSIQQQTNPAELYRQAAQQAAVNQQAGQEAALNRTLTQRGVAGPQAAAAQATLAAQRAKQLFGLDAEAAAMGADFEKQRADMERGVIEAGGKAQDARVQQYLQALRDPQALTAALTAEQQAGAAYGQAYNQTKDATLAQYGVQQQTGQALANMASQGMNAASQAGAQATDAQRGVSAGNAAVGTAVAETMRPPVLSALANTGSSLFSAAPQAMSNWVTSTNAAQDARAAQYRPATVPAATTPSTFNRLPNTPQAGNYQDDHLMPYRRNAQGSM